VVKVDFDGSESGGAQAPEAFDTEQEHQLVLVIWRDAYFDFDQRSTDDTRSDYLVHTVGFLLSEGPRFVSLAQEVLPDGDGFRAVTHIPLSIVERIVPLHLDTEPDQAAPAAE
jgi:hypothetical protein